MPDTDSSPDGAADVTTGSASSLDVVDRRRLLSLGAASLAMVGCLGSGEPTPAPTARPASTPTDSPSPTGTPTPEAYQLPVHTGETTRQEDCAPAAYDAEGRRSFPMQTCPAADHPRHSGDLFALNWSHNPLEVGAIDRDATSDRVVYAYMPKRELFEGHKVKFAWDSIDSAVDRALKYLRPAPDGRRSLFIFGLGHPIAKQWGNRDLRDAVIYTRLAEPIDGEVETLPVEGVPYELPAYDPDAGSHATLLAYESSAVPLKDEYYTILRSDEDIAAEDTSIPLSEPAELSLPRGAPILYANRQSFWRYHTVRGMQEFLDAYYGKIADAGVTVDYLFMDFETGNFWTSDAHINAVRQDPRWTMPEHGMNGTALAEHEETYGFNTLNGLVNDWAKMAAIFEPARKHFPDIKGSDYWSTGIPMDSDVWWSHPTVMGTHGSLECYGGLGASADRHPATALAGDVKRVRGVWNATNGRVMPWFGWKSWSGDSAYPHPYHANRYFDELVRHLALHEADPLMYWAWHGGYDSYEPEQDRIVDRLVTEVANRVAGGYSLRTPSPQFPSVRRRDGRGDEVATGVELADGTALWRLTVNRAGYERGTAFVAGSDPVDVTVERDGDTVGGATVPGGQAGTWWTYDDPTADLNFVFEYA